MRTATKTKVISIFSVIDLVTIKATTPLIRQLAKIPLVSTGSKQNEKGLLANVEITSSSKETSFFSKWQNTSSVTLDMPATPAFLCETLDLSRASRNPCDNTSRNSSPIVIFPSHVSDKAGVIAQQDKRLVSATLFLDMRLTDGLMAFIISRQLNV